MDFDTCVIHLLPEFILLVGACAVLLSGASASGRGGVRGGVGGALSLVTVGVALIATVWLGSPHTDVHPPGLLLTPLLYYVRVGGLSVGLLILLCNLHLPVARERGEFFAMILLSMLGLLLTAAANDLVVFFLAIELVSVPTYVLVSLSRLDPRASEAGVKYFFLGSLAAAVMVYGFSFLYGALGGHTQMIATANAAGLSTVAAATSPTATYVVIGLLLSLAGLFFKLAVVPFHAYAPDVYEGAASPVTGLLGFLPKFAGFVAVVKLLSIFHWDVAPQVMWLLWIAAALTMTVGNALALMQTSVKRILAYSSISHSGYMLIGVIVGPALVAGAGPMRDGVSAMLFYMVVYGAMNLGAFAVLSAVSARGQAVEELQDVEGLSAQHPGLALAMAICCFSLMGFPPLAGMLGKVYIFSSAFSVGDAHPFGGPLIALAIIGVLNSAVGAVYYLRIVAACYNKAPSVETTSVGGGGLRWGVALCSLAMLVLFARPGLLASGAKNATRAFRDTTRPLHTAAVTPPTPKLQPPTSGVRRPRGESVRACSNPSRRFPS